MTDPSAKKGFFGYDDSASEFVFIADATESSNILQVQRVQLEQEQ